jgi:hypothetical protein
MIAGMRKQGNKGNHSMAKAERVAVRLLEFHPNVNRIHGTDDHEAQKR